jgi:hypothetical protein
MPRFIVERQIAGAAGLGPDQLREIARRSLCAIKHLRDVKWQHSVIAGDRVFCFYEAARSELIFEHARRGGFPISSLTEIAAEISPATAEPASAS